MPELDLSGATALRVADQEVLAVRIANIDIWEKQSLPPGEHAVFDYANPPDTLATYNDSPPEAWLGTQFYLFGSVVSWEFVGMRLYVPPSSSAIGATDLHISRMRRDAANGGTFAGQWMPGSVYEDTLAAQEHTRSEPLQAGWNDFYFDSALPAETGDGLIVAYRFASSGTYFYSTDLDPSAAIQASDGSDLYLSELDSEYAARSWYDDGRRTTSHWYGVDIILREAAV
ncbi:hypothetical protein JM654_15345 [Microbacterium oxydans]|nr:hypothetical protein [Microbacterium oxydans]